MRESFRRILRLLLRPREGWERIAREPTSVDALIRCCIVPLALLPPIATFIGMSSFDAEWDPDYGYFVPDELIFSATATTLFTIIASIFVLAGIFFLLAPMFGSARDYRAALNLASYGAAPLLLTGATLFVPAMVVLSTIGLVYTLFLYWVGASIVLEVRKDERAEFVGISMTLLTFVSTLVGASASQAGWF
jgi:hypothetical protein